MFKHNTAEMMFMIIAQGKTKVIRPGPENGTVVMETLDVLTGGDAAKRETIHDIGIQKTTQAANVFTLLNRKGIPTAFIKKQSPNSLLCYQCDMLPLELVVRRYAWGSYLYRHPEFKTEKPHRFAAPVWEFFHKRSVVAAPASDRPYQLDEGEARERFLRNGKWAEGIYTDPYISVESGRWMVYPAKKQLAGGKPLMEVPPECSDAEFRYVVEQVMLPVFKAIEDAWHKVSTAYGPVELVDLKIEVGRRKTDGKIVVADVLDNDSWRIWPGGDPTKQLDKQCFRDDSPLSKVAENYVMVANLTGKFNE